MTKLERNRLVWLADTAWQQIQTQTWDTQAQDILTHWRARQWPMVVTRRRCESTPDLVCLGLPAPAQWGKRKLALNVLRNAISLALPMPSLHGLAQNQPWRTAGVHLATQLMQGGIQAQVYGSYAWQQVTGLTYLHTASDLDLSLNVTHMAQAALVLDLLTRAPTQALPRLDGEVVFPGGNAVAWRELQHLLTGQVLQVLVKDISNVRLASLAELHSLCGEAAA